MNLRKLALQISIINATGTILGFIVNILLGREFGVSWELDCLFISLLIFSFFGIFNTFITSLLIPIFNEIKARDEKEGFEFADVIFKWSLLIGIIGWLIVLIGSPLIIKLFASGFDEKAISLTSEILKLLFIGYIFYNLTSSVSVILNALYLFLTPTLVALLSPILNIFAIFILIPKYGVKSIAISYLFSNAIQVFILIPYLFIKTQWRPTLKVYHEKLPNLINQSSKAVLSSFILSLRDIISRNIASHLGIGAITLLSYADKIISILSQIVISPISSIFYSRVSELIAISRWADIKDILLRTIRINISISIFISAGVIVFLKSFLNLLFLNSRFTENDIYILSYLMIIGLIYIVALSMEAILVRMTYAVKRVNIVLFTAAVSVVLFYMLSKILSSFLNIYGLVLSVSITEIPVFIIYFYFISKYADILPVNIFYPLIKNLVLAISFIIVGVFINSHLKKDIFILFLWCPIWVSLYLAVSRYTLKEEWGILINKKV